MKLTPEQQAHLSALIGTIDALPIHPFDRTRSRMFVEALIGLTSKADPKIVLVEKGFTLTEIKDHLPSVLALLGELLRNAGRITDALDKRSST